MQQLTSRENSNIKQYIKLSAGKQARKKQELFTAEGVRLCSEVLRNCVEPVCCFFTLHCVEQNPEFAVEMQKVVTCYQITPEIAAYMSQTDTPQGVFFIGRMPSPLSKEVLFGLSRILFLHDLQDPGNLGTIIRTADAFGYEAIVLTSKCCDWYSPKVLRAAMGSAFRVPCLVVEDSVAFTQEIQAVGKRTAAAVVSDADFKVGCCNLPEIHVLYIGNEGNGLPQAVVQACDYRLTIPMKSTAESLNASVAAAVLLWELSRRQEEN